MKKSKLSGFRTAWLNATRAGNAEGAKEAKAKITQAGYTLHDDGSVTTKSGHATFGPAPSRVGKAAAKAAKPKSKAAPKAKAKAKPKAAAKSERTPAQKAAARSKAPGKPRLPKGFKASAVATTVEGRKGKQVVVVTKTKHIKSNPFSKAGMVAAGVGGAVTGAILTNVIGRIVATMAPKGAKDPRRKEHAAAAILMKPDAMTLLAQGSVALVSFGGAYYLSKKNHDGWAAFFYGTALGSAAVIAKDVWNFWIAPAIFKTSKPGEQPTWGDRLYFDTSKEAQDSLKARVDELDKLLVGKASASGGSTAGFRGVGQVHGLPEGQRTQLPAMAPAVRTTTVTGNPARAGSGQVGNPGSGQVGCGGCGGRCGGGCGGGGNYSTPPMGTNSAPGGGGSGMFLPPAMTTPALPQGAPQGIPAVPQGPVVNDGLMISPTPGSMFRVPLSQGAPTGTPVNAEPSDQGPMIGSLGRRRSTPRRSMVSFYG